MMHLNDKKLFLVAGALSLLVSCTSVNTQDEESMMNLDDDIASVDTGSEQLGAEDFDLNFEEGSLSAETAPSATDDFSGDSFEDFGSADTSDLATEDFGEESFDDFGSSDTFAEETPVAPLESFDESFEAFEPEVTSEEEFVGSPAAPLQEPAPIFEEPVIAPPPVIAEDPFSAPITPVISGTVAQITDIRYNAGPGGGSLVVVGDAPLNYQTRLNSETNQFVVEIPGANLPERLKRPFLMKDFPNAKIGAVNAYQKSGSTTARIVVQLKDASVGEPLVMAEGNSLNIIPESGQAIAGSGDIGSGEGSSTFGTTEIFDAPYSAPTGGGGGSQTVLAARSLEEFMVGNNKFYGRPISIQIKDADIRDVINFIADESGSNIVLSDGVEGKITLKLRQVPWDQALITVMKANKLGYIRQGNVIRISKLTTLEDETEAMKKVMTAQEELSPVRVKVIPVSFANVATLAEQFKPFLTKDRGNIVADNRTSSLVVTDTSEVLERINRLVTALDIPPAQVMIEGKVVEAGEEFIQSVGVNWGFNGADVNLGRGKFGDVNMLPSLNVQTADPESLAADPFNFGLNIGTMDVLGDLSATLALAERDSLLKIISSPRIVAMNREKATIKQQGEQVTITSVIDQQGNLTSGVNRTPIVVELTVTPQVTNDGNVIMDVLVQREFAGALLNDTINARPINRRSATTKILVRNGQTAVIGGIYQSDSTESETGVPVLKDLPVLGWLFKSKTQDLVKNELLIFLTPRILSMKKDPATLTSSGFQESTL